MNWSCCAFRKGVFCHRPATFNVLRGRTNNTVGTVLLPHCRRCTLAALSNPVVRARAVQGVWPTRDNR